MTNPNIYKGLVPIGLGTNYLLNQKETKQTGGDVNFSKEDEDAFLIYSNYVNGMYDGTPEESNARKVYDKLNRVYYSRAKQAGTTVPNYIMSKVVTM
jgi:hypothetical protein